MIKGNVNYDQTKCDLPIQIKMMPWIKRENTGENNLKIISELRNLLYAVSGLLFQATLLVKGLKLC